MKQRNDPHADIGVIGMAVMGQNLALDIADRGFCVAIYNRTPEKTREVFESRCAGKSMIPAYTLEEFLSCLQRPRVLLLLVEAEESTDRTIAQVLVPGIGRCPH